MHKLFIAFDSAVKSSQGLFKMDTIGDAYIAAEWISKKEHEQDSTHLFLRRAYHRLLWLGGIMIETVAELRVSSGIDLHCRIGIGSGLVLAGALGWLQPRFHLRGPAVLMAEMLEQTAEVDCVNVSTCFLHAHLQPEAVKTSAFSSSSSLFSKAAALRSVFSSSLRTMVTSPAPSTTSLGQPSPPPKDIRSQKKMWRAAMLAASSLAANTPPLPCGVGGGAKGRERKKETDMEVPAGWSVAKRCVHEYQTGKQAWSTMHNGTCRQEWCECTRASDDGAAKHSCVSYSLSPSHQTSE